MIEISDKQKDEIVARCIDATKTHTYLTREDEYNGKGERTKYKEKTVETPGQWQPLQLLMKWIMDPPSDVADNPDDMASNFADNLNEALKSDE
ncbi:MAG: hypothetical protein KAH77_09335 [Thiomargarita sp.]|nr:hypothetical protein [Thiomargarita sp.]